jgi:hypothetical protein
VAVMDAARESESTGKSIAVVETETWQ